VVGILTGHVLKDPESAMAQGSKPVEIEPTLAELERAVSAA
jgi:hypothetical protein